MFGIIILYAFLALTFPLAQTAVACSSPLFFIGVRMCVAGLLLLLYQKIMGSWRMKKGDVMLFVQVIVFHIFFAFVPEFWALSYLSALKVNILYCATPFVSALFERIYLKNIFHFRKLQE